MKIITNSLNNLSEAESPLSSLAMDLSEGGVVYFTIQLFQYEKTGNNEDFSLGNLRDCFPTANKSIEGKIIPIDYVLSKKKIDLYVFCGAMTGDHPQSQDDLQIKYRGKAHKNLILFWEEIEKNFKLPPSRVFEHHPTNWSFFGSWVYWGFCFIYLNEHTRQGIVLAGNASD